VSNGTSIGTGGWMSPYFATNRSRAASLFSNEIRVAPRVFRHKSSHSKRTGSQSERCLNALPPAVRRPCQCGVHTARKLN
jgi:hypothetical protein